MNDTVVILPSRGDDEKPVVANKYEMGPIEMTEDLAMFKQGRNKEDWDDYNANERREIER